MKCIKTKSGYIKRLSDEEAHNIVKKGEAVYTSKEEWKKNDPAWHILHLKIQNGKKDQML